MRFFRESPQIKPLSSSQARKILKVAEGISKSPKSPLQKVFYDLILLAMNTGMRKSEILNLQWKDLKGGEIEVKGKGDKIRTIPLNRIAKEIIQKQPKKMEYVFDIQSRNRQGLMEKSIKRIRKKTGVYFYFHLLRHYFTTSLIEKGVDFITTAEILGHSKIHMSLIYSHTDKSKKKKAVDLLTYFKA